MGMCKIIEQMGKFDPKNWTKTIIPKKWLIVDIKLKALWTSIYNITQFGWKFNIVNHCFTFTTSRYTKLMKNKMICKSIFQLNS
jgi:hypothetical protein